MNVFQLSQATPIELKSQRVVQKVLKTDTRVVRGYNMVLDTCAMALTMDNYREYVARYNEKIKQENQEITQYNKCVIPAEHFNKAQHLLVMGFMEQYGIIATKFCTRTGKEIKIFKRNQDKISLKEYNEKVKELNTYCGVLIPLEKKQTIKAAAERVFQQFLYTYSLQLLRQKQIFEDIQGFKKEKASIRMFRICSTEISELKRIGYKALDLCPKTIRNYRQRFEEAGLLLDYHFLGNQKIGGVLHHITPQILIVYDEKNKKYIGAENQLINKNIGKMFPDITMNKQEHLKNKEKIKANVENNSPSASVFSEQEHSKAEVSSEQEHLTGTPPKAESLLPPHPPAPRPAKAQNNQEFSQKLSQVIQEPYQLCKRLSLGDYNHYLPLDIRVLDKEAYSGTLSGEEFNEILVQEMFKIAASRIYKGKCVFAGSWYRAYTLIKNEYFNDFTKTLAVKSMQLEFFASYRWRLFYAGRFLQKHPDFNLLFPSQYFDLRRTTAQEGGFAYTQKAWKKHLDDQKKNAQNNAVLRAKACERQRRLKNQKSVLKQVKNYTKGRITSQQLFKVVQENYPEFLPKLSQFIQEEISR